MIILTEDQENALLKFNQFLLDPIETVFVLSGYSGTGKSTLVKSLIDAVPNFIKTAKLIDPSTKEWDIQLTATTNKAAEAFASITNRDVSTIHSFLGLRVAKNEKGESTLVPRTHVTKDGYLLFIDEASYVDKTLLTYIFKLTKDCKIVFIGDPAQLTPVKSVGTPVFDANFSGAKLTKVVRQAEGNPIINLSTLFRETVNTGEFFQFTPDGHHIQYMERSDFNAALEQEFSRDNWRHQDSKVLAWTNKCVIDYNKLIRNHVKGDPHFQVGDYAVCNSYLNTGRYPIKTDQLVEITDIGSDEYSHDVLGNMFTIDGVVKAFMPKELAAKNRRIKDAKAAGDTYTVNDIDSYWVDLRAAYSCTINKAQGSTYDRVFIDLDDIRACNSGDQIARMLYVGVSRARHQVYLVGDLVA